MPRLRPRLLRALVLACSCATLAAALGGSATGATSSTVVTLDVPSATTLTPTCATGSAATELGTVLPGTTVSTVADCSVTFGSSNDTAALRMFQQDLGGRGMWGVPDGRPDPGVGAGSGWSDDLVAASAGNVSDVAYDAPRDRFIAAGSLGDDLVVVAYLSNGTLDPSFGTSGWRTFSSSSSVSDGVSDLEIDALGRITIVGRAINASQEDVAVSRLLSNGSLDTSWGTNGVYTWNAGADERVYGLALLPDGSHAICVSTTSVTVGMIRLRPDGTLDPAFDDGDAAPGDDVRAFPHENAYAACRDVEVDSQGRIVVVGKDYRSSASGGWNVAVWRLHPGGAMDTSFDGDGKAMVHVDAYDSGSLLVELDDGDYLVQGSAEPGGVPRAIVARLTSTGAPAPELDGDGGVLVPSPGSVQSSMRAMDVYPDGSMLLGGTYGTGTARETLFVRLLVGGAPDMTFDDDGMRTFAVDPATGESYGGGARGRDGRFALIGERDLATDEQLFVQLRSTPLADYDAAAASWTGADAGVFGVCLRTATGVTLSGWTADAGCSVAADGPTWRAVAATAATGSVATTTTGTSGDVAFRFAMRAAAAQRSGRYLAPLAFEVVAPAA